MFKRDDARQLIFGLVGLITMGLGTGCMTEPQGADANLREASTGLTKVPLASVELAHEQRSLEAIGGRADELLVALTGEELPVRVFHRSVTGLANGVAFAEGSGRPTLKLAYRQANDELWIFDEAVTRQRAAANDVGEQAARAIFRRALASLVAKGTVEKELTEATPKLSHIVQGEGRAGEPPVEKIKEYIFTVPRRINGVEVLNAGVEISVHTNGKVARVKVFGPTLRAAGAVVTQAVAQGDLDSRVARENPSAQVQPLGIRYWLPEGQQGATVEPRQVYFVVPVTVSEGKIVKGRGHYAAYSLRDANEVPTIWPRPDPDAKGDPRP